MYEYRDPPDETSSYARDGHRKAVVMTTSTIKPGRTGLFLAPYVPVGYTPGGVPVFPAQGGRAGSNVEFIIDDAADDEGDPFDERDDDDDDDDGDDRRDERDDDFEDRRRPRQRDDQGDEREPARGESNVAKMEDALRRANNTAARYRRAGRSMEKLGIEDLPSFLLERGIDPETGDPIRGDDDTGDEGEPAANGARRGRTQADIIREMKQAETRGEDRAAARYEGALLAYAAEAALRGAGWKGSDLGLMLRLVDHRAMSIEFDDANDPIVYGLDEQVEAIRREFPDRFHGQEPERETRRPRRRAGAREIDGGDRGRPKPRQTGWLQQLDQRIANGQ